MKKSNKKLSNRINKLINFLNSDILKLSLEEKHSMSPEELNYYNLMAKAIDERLKTSKAYLISLCNDIISVLCSQKEID